MADNSTMTNRPQSNAMDGHIDFAYLFGILLDNKWLIVMTALLALGLGTLNCFLFTRFPVWQRVWSILMRPLFIVSCVFFLFESVPQPYRDWLWYNPIIHLVGIVRDGFYAGYDAPYVSELYIVLLSLGSFLVGLLFLWRYHQELIHEG